MTQKMPCTVGSGGKTVETGSVVATSRVQQTVSGLPFTPDHIVIIWFHTDSTYSPIVQEYDNGSYYASIRGKRNSSEGNITPITNGFTYYSNASNWDSGGSYYIAWKE